ncbi:TonB-dependent receptor [Pedobacter frigiditerrae]|uniref:TonB-dependent receptor n=1 Tax=Pedobacter frigiditerrae TaxID=2530452 RepID=A0A4R0MJ70_9SPHI|nr:TonB-dependent receptor [Pedobacter frigiditerrae]TCC86638.1 TonB-dependent receptor [Pedobacter frigiditerrae]
MKKILLLCAGLLIMFNAHAQFPMGGGGAAPKVTGRITATIIDSLTKQPVDYATISLVKVKDNKTVNGGVTDDKGKISLQNVAADEYKLTIGFIGYKSKTVSVKTTLQKPDFALGNIFLSPTSNTLNEVNVVGQKAVVENKIDRLVYNAEADATNAGGDATDVMRKVPMLSVDINGNVQLRGSSVRVLINGKPSGTMANSVADALKMIPADQIKSVEVITNPSAKYDAEGSGGIINIITKKSNAEGVSGSVNATAGTRQNSGAFNLTAKTGRLSVNTALGTQLAYPQESRVVFRNKTTANNVTTDILQDGISDWTREAYNGSLGLDYDFNAYNNISTNAKYTRFYNGGPGTSGISTNGVASGKIVSSTDMSNGNLDWNMDYKLTTKKQGEEFSISGQLTAGKNTNEFTNDYQTSAGTPISYIASNNVGENKEYTAQTDYVYPFSKTVTFEAGGKAIFRNIQSQYGAGTNQDFDYDQNVGAAYSTIAFNLTKKIQFKGGVRGEYTAINFSNSKNDYFNVFPSAILSQTINGKTTLKLAYNRRVQRPSLAYLNPFRNEANQFSVFQGNPGLKPELSDNMEFGYSTYIKGSIINASLFYRNTKNIIETVNKNDVSGKILSTFENVGTTQSFGFNLFASYNPVPKWTLMSNIALNTYEINSRPDFKGMNEGTFLNYNFFMRSANSFKGGWNLEFFGVVNSPRYTYQSKTEPMFFYGGAVKKDIFKKQGTIGLNVLNPFKRDLHIETVTQGDNNYQSQNIYYPLRSFGLNFSYKFGKLKFTEKKKIKNDDIKQDQNQQGGQGGGMGQGK